MRNVQVIINLCFLLIATPALTVASIARVDTTIVVDRQWKVVDLDNDLIADTIFIRDVSRMRDSIRVRTNRIPAKVLWGDASPQSNDDRDTTLFELAHKKGLSSATKVYDADGDGYKDIVVSYWWGDSSNKKVHERTWAFRGGADLRDEEQIEQHSPSQAFGNHQFALRITEDEYSQATRIGIGGFAIRQRPHASSFEKRQPSINAPIVKTAEVVLSASPNPVSDPVHIRATGLTDQSALVLIITDIMGKVVLSMPTTRAALGTETVVAVQGFASGQYTILLQNEGSVIASTKIIVQR